MKLVLSGYYGFGNVGDEAILYSVILALQKHAPDIEIYVLSNTPLETAASYQVKAVNRWSIPEIAKAIKNADGLISGGGSLFQDQTSLKNVSYYAAIIKFAHLFKKPVYIYAQGMGPISRNVNKWIIKNAFRASRIISVRDQQSKKLLQDIGIQQPIRLVPDPVFAISLCDVRDKSADNRAEAKKIAVSVRDWPGDHSYQQKLATAFDLLAAKGYQFLFVPMHGAYDYQTSQAIVGSMEHDASIAPLEHSFQEKMQLINQSDLLIGMRLHALIFASLGHTPFVAISYDPKIDSFASIIDHPVAADIRKDDWDEQNIVGAVESIFADYAGSVEHMKQKVQPLKDQSEEIAIAIIKDLSEKMTK